MDSFYCLRSGETEWHVKGLKLGQQNISLTDKGRKQAQHAANILVSHTFSTLCYSPLSRTKETAEIIAKECSCSLHPIQNLQARGWGVDEGKMIIQELDELNEDHLPEKMEMYADFKKRVLSGFTEALTFPEPLLLVAHSSVFGVIYKELNLVDPKYAKAALTCISKNLGKWTCEILMES